MSKLHGLDAYGYVVNAWLDGELETSGLSEIPALGWFWSDLLKHRMWMIDELENWAGIIREENHPGEDGDGFGVEDPNDGFDPQRQDDGPIGNGDNFEVEDPDNGFDNQQEEDRPAGDAEGDFSEDQAMTTRKRPEDGFDPRKMMTPGNGDDFEQEDNADQEETTGREDIGAEEPTDNDPRQV